MMYGVWIDNINTLTEYGLALLADVSYGTPAPRFKTVQIPEADGVLDLTEALTGFVRYDTRTVTFRLFSARDMVSGGGTPAPEQDFALIRQKFMNEVHGKRRKLWLPDDPEHYFIGRFNVGAKGAYNSGVIPVTVTADPWRYKNEPTERTFTSAGTYTIQNEKMPARPVFTVNSGSGTVTWGGVAYPLSPGANTFRGIVFGEGGNVVTLAGTMSSVTVRYQEGTL